MSELVATAWASASTFRQSDKRGGANGARIRLAPQNRWAVNDPAQLQKVLQAPHGHTGGLQRRSDGRQEDFARRPHRTCGCAGIEQAAKNAGADIEVPFTPGRMDASEEQTDVESFQVLEPLADGFRNFQKAAYSVPAEEMLIDRAQLLGLTAPEMTVLVGGLRVLGANTGKSKHGVFTAKPETLTNDFFVNILDMSVAWMPVSGSKDTFEGRDRKSGNGEVDGHARRSRVRLQLAAARAVRGLCPERQCPEVPQRLRRRLDQGDERGSLRSRVISTVEVRDCDAAPFGAPHLFPPLRQSQLVGGTTANSVIVP